MIGLPREPFRAIEDQLEISVVTDFGVALPRWLGIAQRRGD